MTAREMVEALAAATRPRVLAALETAAEPQTSADLAAALDVPVQVVGLVLGRLHREALIAPRKLWQRRRLTRPSWAGNRRQGPPPIGWVPAGRDMPAPPTGRVLAMRGWRKDLRELLAELSRRADRATVRQLAEAVGCGQARVRTLLCELGEDGWADRQLLPRPADRPGGPADGYALTPDGRAQVTGFTDRLSRTQPCQRLGPVASGTTAGRLGTELGVHDQGAPA